jgi:hypothetical protein
LLGAGFLAYEVRGLPLAFYRLRGYCVGTMRDEPDAEAKQRYAQFLVQHPDTPEGHRAAAVRLFPLPAQKSLALEVAHKWPSDPLVIEFLVDLRKTAEDDDGQKTTLPTREQILEDIYRIAQDGHKPTSDRLSAYRAYADIAGFTGSKAGNAMQVNFGGNGGSNNGAATPGEQRQRMFLLPSSRPAAEVAAEAETEQHELISAARQS